MKKIILIGSIIILIGIYMIYANNYIGSAIFMFGVCYICIGTWIKAAEMLGEKYQ